MDIKKEALELHEKYKGKIEVVSKVPLATRNDLSLAYTPGVAEPCRKIAENIENVYKYTSKGNLVAVVTDGTAVLGLGDIGPEAALPVMEGKCILFKQFGNVDAFPICLKTKDVDEIVDAVVKISPVFGGINLEDISAPRCFEIEEKLKEKLKIPVFHDDQHGTAIVVLAALINALKLVKKGKEIKIVISGAGAAGTAVAKILLSYSFKNIIVCDTKGAIYSGRDGLNSAKEEIASITNPQKIKGSMAEAMKGADVFIGVSAPNIVTKEMVKTMKEPIVFAMANPVPEIMPADALEGGARIVATGRSDFPNQINNVLAFPGIFKGALKVRKQITEKMKISAAEAIASLVAKPAPDKIIPSVFDNVADAVAEAVMKAAGNPIEKAFGKWKETEEESIKDVRKLREEDRAKIIWKK
jgi:malate dehydrogenase (oxaloacetate-decarboxylating)